jgi:hypothetical protein
MPFPFVTRSHHEDMIAELRSQLSQKESERQKFIDILAQMGWGVKVFGTDDEPQIEETPETVAPATSTPTVPLSRMRPSQAARVKSAEMQRRYDEKTRTIRKNAVIESVAAIIGGEQLQA